MASPRPRLDAALTPESVADYLATTLPGAPVRLGLVSNPMARTNWRSVGHRRLVPLLADASLAVQTPSVADVAATLRALCFGRGVNVLAINGGDGTIHHTVNVALAVAAEASAVVGMPVPMPRVLLLNGGGMNMLARTFHTRGHPVRTVRRFMERYGAGTLGQVPVRDVPLLEVEEPDGTVRRGVIFGSELVLNALTLYERFGQGYRGLSRFLGTAAVGYAFKTEAWERFGHLLDPPTTALTVDGTRLDPYASVVASTVPMTLLRGAVVTVPRVARPGTLEGLVVRETEPGRILQTIPALMRAQPHAGVASLSGAQDVRLHGPYTLDGERLTRLASGAPITVRPAEATLRGVALA